MARILNRYVLVLLVLRVLLLAVIVRAESLDSRTPSEWHDRLAAEKKVQKRWLPARIQQLEIERAELLYKISGLPQHAPKPLVDRRGYHSLINKHDSESTVAAHEIIADFAYPVSLGSIALAPVLNSMSPEGATYAFPKRFKIDVLDSLHGFSDDEDSQKVKGKNASRWAEVVNWLEEDFPDPGPYPVYFSDINMRARKVRITVPCLNQVSGASYYALGELYLFKAEKGHMADSMSMWGKSGVKFNVSDSLKMSPLWDDKYLYDGIVGLGIPLSEERVEIGDFVLSSATDGTIEEKVQLLMDLGQIFQVGRIEIWPAEAPHKMAVPLFGFPGKIQVELSEDAEFKKVSRITIEDTINQMPHNHVLTVICNGYEARYIRIVMEGVPKLMGHRILGIGEISVSEHGRVFSVGCKVTAEGIPERGMSQLSRLVDGYSWHRRILPEQDWIRGLAIRRPLDRRLEIVERELKQVEQAWYIMQMRLSVGGGAVLLLAMLGGWAFQVRQRRNALNKLKLRVTRDLHDEVGSGLGGISLTCEQLEGIASNEEMKEELSELSLMAREACASLREVVWVTDQETIRLPALIEKLVERAERVLRGVVLDVSVAPNCPDLEVSLNFKRHLIMFFKEAVHNCARHADATKASVLVDVDGGELHLEVSDNGCGFDMTQNRDGWGLDSMKKRAAEIGGDMELESKPGEGTRVKVTVPLALLETEPLKAYRTSN